MITSQGLRAFLPKAELLNRVNNFSELKENVSSLSRISFFFSQLRYQLIRSWFVLSLCMMPSAPQSISISCIIGRNKKNRKSIGCWHLDFTKTKFGSFLCTPAILFLCLYSVMYNAILVCSWQNWLLAGVGWTTDICADYSYRWV